MRVVEKENDKEAIDVKWVYKVKHHPFVYVENNKTRLVAKDYAQQPGIDNEEEKNPEIKKSSWNSRTTH